MNGFTGEHQIRMKEQHNSENGKPFSLSRNKLWKCEINKVIYQNLPSGTLPVSDSTQQVSAISKLH